MMLPLFTLATLIGALAAHAFAQEPDPANPKRTSAAAADGHAGGASSASSNGSAGVVPRIPQASPGQIDVNGSDNCGTPDSISGGGPFSFNNVGATTGPQGQTNANCNFYGVPGIDRDVWFTWTASATGGATLSLCAGASGTDSKVAVYDGAGCPVSQAIGCNDDTCGLVSEVVFCCVTAHVYTVQLGSFPNTPGTSGSFTIVVVPGGSGNDECAGATALGATGPYAFDTSTATTGCKGQDNANCNFFASPRIENDRWYTWTANATGTATVQLCGQTGIDSKVAVYTGAGCPSGQALACNDDLCGLQSSVCFPATTGQTYTIQLGNYPGTAGGTGTFNIGIAPPPPPCRMDDGSSEDLLGWNAGGEMVWMQRFGSVGGSTPLAEVQVVWGSPAFPGSGPGNGAAAKVALWDDPNDDGNPNDAVLLQLVNTTVAGVDTDAFNTIPLAPVSLNGVFFVGAGLAHAAGDFVAPMDESCPTPGVAWFFGNNNATPVDYGNVLNNAQVPRRFDSIGLPANVMIRAGCDASPMTAYCFPGQGGVISCPCSNPPAGSGQGCNNFGAGSADSCTLSATGTASLSADTVVFLSTGENNTSLTVFLQGTTQLSSGVPFGAGVRCLGGVLKRLYSGLASGGTILRPSGANPTVHARSAQLGNPILSGQTRYYMTYYRDPSAAGPCGNSLSTFNASQAGSVVWQ